MATSAGRHSWGLVAGVATLSVGLRLLGCGPAPQTSIPGDDFDREALLRSLGVSVVMPAQAEFLAAAEDLADASARWADAAHAGSVDDRGEDDDVVAAREATRLAWRDAMDAWQHLEVLQVGPAASSAASEHGQDLRDAIYSWPTVNPCRVDQELVAGDFAAAGYFDAALVNVQGLDAIEYLAFVEGDSNQCPPQVEINSSGAWQALVDSGDLASERAAYSAAAAEQLVANAARLQEAWEQGFLDELALSGHAGVNDFYAALYYLEAVAKDEKLGTPLGLMGCTEATCPEDLESPWADHALPSLRANLAAGRAILSGGASLASGDGSSSDDDDFIGFIDLLRAVDEGALAEDLVATLDAAVLALDGVPQSGQEALREQPDALLEVYLAIDAFTDLVKTDLALALLLEVPGDGPSDTD